MEFKMTRQAEQAFRCADASPRPGAVSCQQRIKAGINIAHRPEHRVSYGQRRNIYRRGGVKRSI